MNRAKIVIEILKLLDGLDVNDVKNIIALTQEALPGSGNFRVDDIDVVIVKNPATHIAFLEKKELIKSIDKSDIGASETHKSACSRDEVIEIIYEELIKCIKNAEFIPP
jgi:hypothetical protein